MDFDEFWDALERKQRVCSEFVTLRRSKQFEARMTVDRKVVVVTPKSTGDSRHVPQREFRRIWNIIKNDPRECWCVNKNGRLSEFWNPSYVCAIIAYVVGNLDME